MVNEGAMFKAGRILIFIMFIIESIFIIPLLWTIPGFVLYNKINKGQATEGHKIAFAVLGIIFGAVIGIIGSILMLVDLYVTQDKNVHHQESKVV